MLIEIAAPHAEALQWKIDRLFGEDAWNADDDFAPAYCTKWMQSFLTDVRRLVAAGRA